MADSDEIDAVLSTCAELARFLVDQAGLSVVAAVSWVSRPDPALGHLSPAEHLAAGRDPERLWTIAKQDAAWLGEAEAESDAYRDAIFASDRAVLAWARKAGVPLMNPPRVPEAAAAMYYEIERLRAQLADKERL